MCKPVCGKHYEGNTAGGGIESDRTGVLSSHFSRGLIFPLYLRAPASGFLVWIPRRLLLTLPFACLPLPLHAQPQVTSLGNLLWAARRAQVPVPMEAHRQGFSPGHSQWQVYEAMSCLVPSTVSLPVPASLLSLEPAAVRAATQ